MEKLPQDMYRLLALDEDISERQRQQRDRRAELIAPLLVEECICDKSYRNKVLREIISGNSVSRKTVLQYLWLYWVYQSKNALLPAEKSGTEKRPLSSDEKAIRWALNKFYYTPQKQSLQTSYKMMLQAKYCDAKGKLKPDYPSFWQFRYYFRQHRDPISESISREGIKAYQRNHRPFTGAVSDYSIRELYGTNHINVPVELCGALSSLLEAIPAKALTAKDIIMQHTLYPYYTRFFSNNRKKSAYMLALNGNRHAGQHIGIYQSSSMDARRLRYCPQCFDEDIVTYGEPYWHRLHQIPGIAVCPRHGCWLADTEITLTGHRHNLLFPALPDCHLLPTPDTTPTTAQKTYAALMQDALTAPYDFCDSSGYRAIIKRALRNRGYASVTGGRIYAARIAEAVNAFYGNNVESVDLHFQVVHILLQILVVPTRRMPLLGR